MINKYLCFKLFTDVKNITSYKGNYANIKFPANTLVLDYEGLQKQRELYSPVYVTDKQIASRVADFRNLLYWSPNIITDKQGKAQVSFYTSDKTGKYVIMIQGISAEGKAAYLISTLNVEGQNLGLK